MTNYQITVLIRQFMGKFSPSLCTLIQRREGDLSLHAGGQRVMLHDSARQNDALIYALGVLRQAGWRVHQQQSTEHGVMVTLYRVEKHVAWDVLEADALDEALHPVWRCEAVTIQHTPGAVTLAYGSGGAPLRLWAWAQGDNPTYTPEEAAQDGARHAEQVLARVRREGWMLVEANGSGWRLRKSV